MNKSETFNLARLKKGNDIFEVVINPDKAIEFKHGKVDITDALVYPKIFSDAKKGMLASEHKLQELFKTSDPVEVAKIILNNGMIQVTSDYRNKIVEEKRKRIIDIINRNSVDPKTNLPHPISRIEAAMNEAKVRIDESKPAENQVQDILKQLKIIIPIKFVIKEIDIIIPACCASKSYSQIKSFGRLLKDEWQNDGSWHGIIEIPGGIEQDFYDKINNLTHGDNQMKVSKVVGE